MRVVLTGKFRQGPLWDLVERYGSQLAVAKLLGVSGTTFGGWLNFHRLPSRQRICKRMPGLEKTFARLGVLIEDVFPEKPVSIRMNGIKKSIEVQEEFLIDAANREPLLLSCSFEQELDDKERIEEVNRFLMTELTVREESIIRQRFGIGGESPKTLEELSEVFDVCKERVKQIEAKALRKLRRPSVSRVLRKWIGG